MTNSEEKPDRKWISIKERLPDKEGWYLVWCPESFQFPAERINKTSIRMFKNNKFTFHDFVSHWMPLPEPPK